VNLLGNSGDSGEIERAWAARSRAFDDVEVDHGGGDVGMAEKILDGSDVGAILEEARSKGMPEGVTGGALGDISFADGVFELSLHGGFVDVMAGDASGVGMWAEGCRGEDVLPGPFAGGVWSFAQQGFGHVDFSGTHGEVMEVFVTGFGKMVFQRVLKG